MMLKTGIRMSIYLGVLTILAILAIVTLGPSKSSAISGSEFQPGRIIDDALFYNSNTMTVTEIQNFLNSKVPSCDTNGELYYGSVTRASYSTSRGYPPPFTCLKDYRMDTPFKAGESGLCDAITAKTNQSTAQIIDTIASSCGISEKVILVMLQKEQGLVTDDWPWPIQYTKAMGYYCPDDPSNPGWCHPDYAGFFNQVYNAARQFQRYKASPNVWNHIPYATNNILYQANAPGCGTRSVYIENYATAGLYNYTPYTPNAAALNNLYGTGDACSAYGNRNFWRYYWDWFGNTHVTAPYAWALVSQEAYSDSSYSNKLSTTTGSPGSTMYFRIRAVNYGYQPWDNSFIRIGTSGPYDRLSSVEHLSWLYPTRPTNLKESTIEPGQTGTFEFAVKVPSEEGYYKETFNLVAENRTWMNNIGLVYGIRSVTPRAPDMSADDFLTQGKVLYRGEYLISKDKQSVLSFNSDGNVVLYTNFKKVWSTNTRGTSSSKLFLQSDGNLVLYTETNVPTWNSATNSGKRVEVRTDGNLIIVDELSNVVWSTNTTHNPDLLGVVNASMPVGVMYLGQKVETIGDGYKLFVQTDGNLVLYDKDNRALWASWTQGKNAKRLLLQTDGNLVLYDGSNRAIWNTRTGGRGKSVLVMQTDGNLVLYDKYGRPTWSTRTSQGR